MNIKGLTKYEAKMLLELQTIQHEGLPLMRLVEKNYRQRFLTDKQISDALYALVMAGKIDVCEELLAAPDFAKLIIAHYESKHIAKA